VKILLVVDDRPDSADAVETVTSQEWPPDTEIRVISVAKAGGGPRPHQAERELAERAEEITTRVVDLLRASGFSANAVVHFGKAHIAIVEEARDWSADLIVISGHYNGVTRSQVSDEHTRWVVNHAPCSVKVIS